jgi:hypothetical protein
MARVIICPGNARCLRVFVDWVAELIARSELIQRRTPLVRRDVAWSERKIAAGTRGAA